MRALVKRSHLGGSRREFDGYGAFRSTTLGQTPAGPTEPRSMNRTLEHEIMGDVEQSLAYANADFSLSNQRFVDHLVANHTKALRHVIDIGCGPCDVMVRLADALTEVRIVAIDGSAEMIKLASRAVSAAH